MIKDNNDEDRPCEKEIPEKPHFGSSSHCKGDCRLLLVSKTFTAAAAAAAAVEDPTEECTESSWMEGSSLSNHDSVVIQEVDPVILVSASSSSSSSFATRANIKAQKKSKESSSSHNQKPKKKKDKKELSKTTAAGAFQDYNVNNSQHSSSCSSFSRGRSPYPKPVRGHSSHSTAHGVQRLCRPLGVVETITTTYDAVVMIQACMRGYLQRRANERLVVELLALCEYHAACIINALVRRFLQYRLYTRVLRPQWRAARQMVGLSGTSGSNTGTQHLLKTHDSMK